MSDPVVVGAGVAVTGFVKAEGAEDAFPLLEGASEIRAPQIIFGEVADALWKKARRGDIAPQTGVDALGFLPGGIGRVIATEGLLSRAPHLACAVDHPVPDCLYVEGAWQLDLPLITAAARLIRKFVASPYAASILPLSDWRS